MSTPNTGIRGFFSNPRGARPAIWHVGSRRTHRVQIGASGRRPAWLAAASRSAGVVEPMPESERSGKAGEPAGEFFGLPEPSPKRPATARTLARPGKATSDLNGEPCHAQTITVTVRRHLVRDPAQPSEDMERLVTLAYPDRRIERQLLRDLLCLPLPPHGAIVASPGAGTEPSRPWTRQPQPFEMTIGPMRIFMSRSPALASADPIARSRSASAKPIRRSSGFNRSVG